MSAMLVLLMIIQRYKLLLFTIIALGTKHKHLEIASTIILCYNIIIVLYVAIMFNQVFISRMKLINFQSSVQFFDVFPAPVQELYLFN